MALVYLVEQLRVADVSAAGDDGYIKEDVVYTAYNRLLSYRAAEGGKKDPNGCLRDPAVC